MFHRKKNHIYRDKKITSIPGKFNYSHEIESIQFEKLEMNEFNRKKNGEINEYILSSNVIDWVRNGRAQK